MISSIVLLVILVISLQMHKTIQASYFLPSLLHYIMYNLKLLLELYNISFLNLYEYHTQYAISLHFYSIVTLVICHLLDHGLSFKMNSAIMVFFNKFIAIEIWHFTINIIMYYGFREFIFILGIIELLIII